MRNRRARRRQLWRWREVRTNVHNDLKYVRNTSARKSLRRSPTRSVPSKQRVGVVLSYVGMAAIVLYCIIPFYWMIVSSLRLPTEGRSTEFIPSPTSIENYQAVFSPRTTSAAH